MRDEDEERQRRRLATPKPRSNRLSDAPSAGSEPPLDDDGGEPLGALDGLIALDTLSVVFQPIVDIRTGKVFAHEALVRCTVPEFRNPMVLFERAVERGCTGPLGRLIREIGVPLCGGERLFVNVHPTELSQSWLVRPDDPIFSHDDEVFIEVTESVPMTHFDLCMGVCRELGSRGSVHLVVDDLGAGYSNLLRIADLEPRIVKLDRQLITHIDRRPRQQRLVAAIVRLCEDLGAGVVAEGIETLGELTAIRDAGAHYAQGYLLARPSYPIPNVSWPFGPASDAAATAASTTIPCEAPE